MDYKPDFVKRVHDAFPEGHPIHEVLDKGCDIGGMLRHEGLGMSPQKIIDAFHTGQPGSVLDAALRARRIEKLYGEFVGDYSDR
jgi:hypothetical protein